MPTLYLLTNEDPLPILLKKLDSALATGVIHQLQIRRKNTPHHQLPTEIDSILNLANQYQIPVIINDNIALAHTFKTGVHLGQNDGDITNARQLLGQAIIGKTCHTSTLLATQAINEGADYVAMGAVFTSHTKPYASSLLLSQNDLDVLNTLINNGLNLCVIGGITVNNLPQLHQKLLGIRPHQIAISHDILGKKIDDIANYCQQWKKALLTF